MSNKICTKCKLEKEVVFFRKKSSHKDGLCYWCVDCEKQYRLNNKQKMQLYNKNYRKQNKDLLKITNKNYYEKNKLEILKKQNLYYQKNKEAIKISRREYSMEYAKKYYKKNKEEISAKNKTIEQKTRRRKNTIKHKENNKEKYVIYGKTALEKEKLSGYKNSKKYQSKNKEKIALKRKEKYNIVNEKKRQKRKENPEIFKIKDMNEGARRRALLRNDSEIIYKKDIEKMFLNQKEKCFWCDSIMIKYTIDHYMPLSKGGKHRLSNIVLCCKSCNSAKNAKLPEEFAKIKGKIINKEQLLIKINYKL